MRASAILLILSTVGVATASAQSLADVARKESERRQTVKEGAGKSYTNQDLKPVPEPAGADTAASADAEPGGADGKAADVSPTEDKADAKDGTKAKGAAEPPETRDQAYWSKRMAHLREQLDRDETFRDALQSRIDALTTDFINRDDPAQRGQISADRQKALTELDRIKKAIELDKRAIPDLEEEARREGVPPGWLR
jgi:hypothetical protein